MSSPSAGMDYFAPRTHRFGALRCHPQTVRERIHRFNAEGLDGLDDRPGAGRKRRITETERSFIISLARAPIRQGGRSVRGAGGELESRDEEKEAHWTLDALSPPLPKRAWDHRWAKLGTSHFARRRGEVAQPPSLGESHDPE